MRDAAADASASGCSARSCGRSSSTPPTRRASGRRPRRCGGSASAWRSVRRSIAGHARGSSALSDAEIRAGADRSRLRHGEHRGARRRVHPARLAAVRRVQRRSRRRAPAYSQGLAELFDDEPLMARFRERFDVRLLHGRSRRCSRRWWRATASGAARRRRRGSRSSTGARCRRAASSRSCATRSRRAGVPTMICRSARPRVRRHGADGRRAADRPRLPPRADQRHRRARRTSAARWSTPTRAARSASPTRCAARSRTRKRSSPC